MVPFLHTFSIPYMPLNAVAEPQGSFYVVFRNSLIHPLWCLMVDAATNYNTTLPSWILNQASDEFGIEALGNGQGTPGEQDDQLVVQQNVVYNLLMPMLLSGVDWVTYPIKNVLINGDIMYGYLFSGGTGTVQIQFGITIGVGAGMGDTIQCFALNQNGQSVNVISAAATAGQTVFNITTPDFSGFMSSDATLGGHVSCRSNIWGFTFQYISTNNVYIPIANIKAGGVFGTPPTSMLVFKPFDWPAQSQAVEMSTAYRPVSGSAWVAYQGSLLTGGGNAAAVMYRGGMHPFLSQMATYQQIADAEPESYEDKVIKGTYSFILPASTNDTSMREIFNSKEWTHPFIAIAGNLNLPTGQTFTELIRMRAAGNYELVSDNQMLQYGYAEYSPRMIEDAVRRSHRIPTTVENDMHLSDIWKWLKERGTDVKDWFVENPEVAQGLIRGGIRLAGALL